MPFFKKVILSNSTRRTSLLLSAVLIPLSCLRPVCGKPVQSTPTQVSLQADRLHNLMQSLGSGDSYSAVSSLILENPRGPGATMTAFEENPLFVYAVGRVRRLIPIFGRKKVWIRAPH